MMKQKILTKRRYGLDENGDEKLHLYQNAEIGNLDEGPTFSVMFQ